MATTKLTTKKLSAFGASETVKSYFSILLTLGLLIVLVLLIYPAIQHITKINREISDAKVVKTKLETKLGDLNTARINLEAIESDLPTLDLALPLGSDLASYLIKIESFAKKRKLSIEALQFSDVPLSKPDVTGNINTKQFTYTLTLGGKFTDFQKFLSDLENYIRTSDVNTVNLSKEKEGGKSGSSKDQVLESLDVTAYYIGIDFKPGVAKTSTDANNQSTTGGGQ